MNGFVLWSMLLHVVKKQTMRAMIPVNAAIKPITIAMEHSTATTKTMRVHPSAKDCGEGCGDTGEDTEDNGDTGDTGTPKTPEMRNLRVYPEMEAPKVFQLEHIFHRINDLNPPPTFDLPDGRLLPGLDGDGFDDVISTGPYANGYLEKSSSTMAPEMHGQPTLPRRIL